MKPHENEIWRPVKGYEESYEVSNLGRVRSLPRTVDNGKGGRGGIRKLRGRIRKSFPGGKGGYLYVGLHCLGKRKSFTVHGLVFRAFVENPKNLPEINHDDGNNWNNRDSNLIPSTRQENVRHAIRTGLCPSMVGPKNIMAKLCTKQVRRIRKMFARGISQTQIASTVGTTFQNVHCIVRRKSWQHIE